MSCKRFILSIVVLGLPGFAFTGEHPALGAPTEASSMSASDDRMAGPLHRQMVTVFVLPEMQSELGLSAQQVSQLRSLRHDLQIKSKDLAGQTATHRKELDQLLSGDTSRTRAVKALFEKIAELRAQMQFNGFETANKMKAILTDDQRSKFDALKPADLHRLMMSRGNRGEMEQTMQLMAGGDGMRMRDGL